MPEVKILREQREIRFTGVPHIIPPRDMRATWHRLLDEALDAFRADEGEVLSADNPDVLQTGMVCQNEP